MLLLLGILLIFIGTSLYIKYKRLQIIGEKVKLTNYLMFLSTLNNKENSEAYLHWDYKKYATDREYLLLSSKDYVRKYLWFYNMPDQRIHYRKENFWDMPEHKNLQNKGA